MKQAIIFILVIVGIIGGAIFVSNRNKSSETGATGSDNYYGKADGIVTVTEFGDFQCPGCGSFYPTVKEVKEKFKDQIRFEFKHFPIISLHPNAMAGHRAAQAAANQGKFWDMHDQIYATQSSWSTSDNAASIFEGYAEQLGLDMEKYRTDVAASQTLDIINADISEGQGKGVTGTPSFFIDGVNVETSEIGSADAFSKKIQEAIDAKKDSQDSSDNSGEQDGKKPEDN